MKKIMFNDQYALTAAVLARIKTMTRRVAKEGEKPQYEVGEVVAIAQNYMEAGYDPDWVRNHVPMNPNCTLFDPFNKRYPGWGNKMFVSAEYMPHQIRITGIRREALQDIPFEDCEREGLLKIEATATRVQRWTFKGVTRDWISRWDAFRELIKKVSGRKVWNQNPQVWVYSFELVK